MRCCGTRCSIRSTERCIFPVLLSPMPVIYCLYLTTRLCLAERIGICPILTACHANKYGLYHVKYSRLLVNIALQLWLSTANLILSVRHRIVVRSYGWVRFLGSDAVITIVCKQPNAEYATISCNWTSTSSQQWYFVNLWDLRAQVVVIMKKTDLTTVSFQGLKFGKEYVIQVAGYRTSIIVSGINIGICHFQTNIQGSIYLM